VDLFSGGRPDVVSECGGTDINLASLEGGKLLNALHIGVQRINSKSQYIKRIAVRFKGLEQSVESASNELKMYIDSIVSCMKVLRSTPAKQKQALADMVKRMIDAKKAANTVIDEATHIKMNLLEQ
jgi:hypothetical protein